MTLESFFPDHDTSGNTITNDLFKAAAVLGSMFSVTCISETAAVAWMAHDVIDGLAANVGSIDLA